MNESDLKTCFSSISYFLLECARSQITKRDFGASLSDIVIAEAEKRALFLFYNEHEAELRNILSSSANTLKYPKFSSLEWRLDTQIASRSIQNIAETNYILRFNLETESGHSYRDIQLEYADLVHLSKELGVALSEARNRHINRTMRYIK